MSADFIQDSVHNQIAGKLTDSFFQHYRFRPSPNEVNSWRNSLRAISQVFDHARLNDHGVILEYQLPLTSKRLDCLICGRDEAENDRAVVVELKQWDKCSPAEGEDLVATWVGGAEREVLHPSAQVRQYQLYLQDNHTAFHDGSNPVKVDSCAYLHNYEPVENDVILSSRFLNLLKAYPTFTADDVGPLERFLADRLSKGHGDPVLRRIEESKYRPSKKLMDHVGNVIKGTGGYILLDEQLVVFEKILACATAGFEDRRRTVLIVRGGPGTGKSVIAINVMAELLLAGRNAQYATGSKAFTETLRKIVGPRGSIQFKYFNSYGQAEPGIVDVLVCDEAHRIRRVSANQYTPKDRRTNKPQVREILDAAKVSVFLVDDRQVVRPDEIGSSKLIREAAEAAECRVFEYELEAQFRCAGSDGFVNWVNNTLGLEKTANVIWEGDENFEFQILDSPESVESAVREKAKAGLTARMTAGFCWPWSDPKPDGTLVEDIQIGSYRRPWNAKSDAKRLAKGIPKAVFWAHDPNGINQVGCVYTAQGFEFDYEGVIFGHDLRYNFADQQWVGHPESSHDKKVKQGKDRFVDLVKNTYRVLLSRALKGCYVYFMDKETEQFFRSRMEIGSPRRRDAVTSQARLAETPGIFAPVAASEQRPFRLLEGEHVNPFENCVPVYDLDVAAGRFGETQDPAVASQDDEIGRPSDFEWAELPPEFRPRKGLFVARVVGESMNRRIPNGSWCLFRLNPQGSREGRTVLVQSREIDDPETGGHFTIKVYSSEKRAESDGSWSHSRIVLRPDSTISGYEAIVLAPEQADGVRVIAELVAVLG